MLWFFRLQAQSFVPGEVNLDDVRDTGIDTLLQSFPAVPSIGSASGVSLWRFTTSSSHESSPPAQASIEGDETWWIGFGLTPLSESELHCFVFFSPFS